MSYLDEAGLARYDGLLKDLALRTGAGYSLLNWQRTEAAGAVSFLPVPEMPIDPVVNFLFSETGPAEGTKSPDNPSIITGVTQAKVTRCGKNLIKTPYVQTSTTVNDVTFTVNGDGSVTVNGTASDVARFYLSYSSGGVLYKNGLTYMLSGCPSGGSWSSYYLGCVGPIVNNSWKADTGSGASVTPSGDGGLAVAIVINTGTAVSNLVFKPQLELGSAVTAFEPYEGADYTVNLGGTYYGGSVDLSAGTMAVTVGGSSVSTFTSATPYTNVIQFGAVLTYRHLGNMSPPVYGSNRFTFIANNSDVEHWRQTGSTGSLGANFYINKTRLDVSGAVDPSNPTDVEWLAAGNAWLANNPIFVVSSLFTPQIVQLTPQQIYSLSQPDPYTPRVNTVYSDQVSVQVGYPKSPQASQTELTNAIVSLGGNV